jgi:hypothetical protein
LLIFTLSTIAQLVTDSVPQANPARPTVPHQKRQECLLDTVEPTR